MNALSWLIYVAEVLDKLNVLLGLLIMASVIVVAVTWVGRIAIAMHLMDFDYPDQRQPEGTELYKTWQRWARASKNWRLIAAPVIFAVLSSVIPSSATVYMIAASEAGEAVVTSDSGREMLGDLQEIIRKRLKDALGEDTSDGIDT